MARVEKNEAVSKEVAAMKDEMVQTVKMSGNRKSKFALGCLIIFVLAVLAVLGLGAWTLAATGLVRVPVVSSWAYEVPAPAHAVEPGLPLDTKINDDLTAEINRRLIAGGGQIKNRTISLDLPEESFTALFKSLIEQSGVEEISSKGAQIAVLPGQGLELFLPLADNPQQSALIVWLRVVPDAQGLLDIKVDHIQLGAFDMPGYLYGPIIQPVIQQNMEQLNREWGRYATFQDIEYETGNVKVIGTIAVEILDL